MEKDTRTGAERLAAGLSPLKTRVRCCDTPQGMHLNREQLSLPVMQAIDVTPDHEYSEIFGRTQVYCPECGGWFWMGTDMTTFKHIGECSLSEAVMAGQVPRKHAYMSEIECQKAGKDYMAQFEAMPEGG